MAVFSTNQVKQLYVADKYDATLETVGSISVGADSGKTQMYFKYMGAGGQTRSDLIDIKNITSAVATDADKMVRPLRTFKLVLDKKVNSGTPVAGQDYITRIWVKNYIGISEEDQTFKFGVAHAYTGMTASDFYKVMAMSLVRNFNSDEENLVKIYLEVGGTKPEEVTGTPTEVTKLTKESTLSDTYTGIVIEEKPQEWALGVFMQNPVNFEVIPTTIVANSEEVIWGIATKVVSTKVIDNGKTIADMEYFFMGERGDVYRYMGFPNSFRTKYLVDPDKKYNTINIHYFFKDSGESVQQSEKDIMLVVPKVGTTNKISNALTNTVITAINTASGLTIATLDVSE